MALSSRARAYRMIKEDRDSTNAPMIMLKSFFKKQRAEARLIRQKSYKYKKDSESDDS